MRSFRLTKRPLFQDYLLLLILVLLAYWPLSLNYLSLKNDALVQYLAYRYHLSEAIQNGYLPLWNPYLYTGFPIHADMQGEVWNPFVLVLSLIHRYNMTMLQWEVLIYLCLAAIGMYRLIVFLKFSRATAICCAISFVCCGYMTDSISIIPWISSAAFIPFVLLYFLKFLQGNNFRNAIRFGCSLSLMFLCGYPSFFIFLNYILAVSFLFWVINQVKAKDQSVVWKTTLLVLSAYFLFLLLCSPAIISYYEFLPYYSRGSGLSFARASTNPFLPFSLITYILPNVASKADSLTTDQSMRNAFLGIFILLFFLAQLLKYPLNGFRKLVLAFTIFSFLFSLGNLLPLQQFCYRFLPLMNTFRHPGSIRIFTSTGMILLSAFALDDFFKTGKEKIILALSYLALAGLTASLVYFLVTNYQGQLPPLSLSPSVAKTFLHQLSFQSFAAGIAIIQIAFVAIFILLLYRQQIQRKLLAVLLISNSILFAWIAMPFTVVSQYRTKEVNSYLASFPDGYPLPDLSGSVRSEVFSDSTEIAAHGYYNFYNKQIAIQDYIITPTLNSDYGRFLNDKSLRVALKGYPFVYLTDLRGRRINGTIVLKKFTPNHFVFEVDAAQDAQFNIFQQYHHSWNVSVNGNNSPIHKSNLAFMRTDIPAGHSVVEWMYRPVRVYGGMIVSGICLLAVLFYFVVKRKKTIHE